MSEPKTASFMVDFYSDIQMFQTTVRDQVDAGQMLAGSLLICSGAAPEHSTTRLMPFLSPKVKGKEDIPQFFAVACITRDMILTLISLNQRFQLGMTEALDLLGMTHPMVQQALANGNVAVDEVAAGENPKRVIRDIVEVGAGGKGGQA